MERLYPALKDYAYVQMQLGELATAKQTYQRVLTVEPTSRQALLHLGMIEAKLGNVTNAAAHYLTLIKHNPDFMDTYVQLANLHESSGDLAAAEQALTMGIQHEPTWAPGYLWRGKIYQKQRASDLAETDFRHAIQLAPMCRFRKKHWHPYSRRKTGNSPRHGHLLRLSLKGIADRYIVPHWHLSIIASSACPMHTVKLKPLLRKPLNTRTS